MSGNGQGRLAVAPGMMSSAPAKEPIFEVLPYLRRYARALTGSQESGDAFVRATLEAVLNSSERHGEVNFGRVNLGRVNLGRIELYEAFSKIWNSAIAETRCEYASHEPAQHRLAKVSPVQRQALLLTQLEEFSLAEAGKVLGLSAAETAVLVGQAMVDIEQDLATDILVIEDEPLISSHIEAIVEEMGHRVVAVAATAAQASAAYAAHRPGLVLADIQLADGSSGLTAVDHILALAPVPIIFITAYPEQLLTGERPEPSFLVAKPFREESLRASIGQALFFGTHLRVY